MSRVFTKDTRTSLITASSVKLLFLKLYKSQELCYQARESIKSNFIDGVEFYVLFDVFETKNPDFPHYFKSKFTLEEWSSF